MAQGEIPVRYLDTGVLEQTQTGLVLEMCPECSAMAPTERIRDHIDSHQPPEREPGHPGQAPPPDQPEVGQPMT